MKKYINEKIRLVLTVAVCMLFVAVAFSSAVGKTPSNRNFVLDSKENGDTSPGPSSSNSKFFRSLALPEWFYKIFNYDWNYWSNPPDMYAIPEGNVGIGDIPPDDAKLYIKTEPTDWKYAIYAEGQKGIKGISTALDGTGITGEGGHAGVAGNGGYIGILGQGFYGGWFEGMGYFSGNVGIGTNEPQSTLDIFDNNEPAEIRLASGLAGGSGTINFVNSGWTIRSGLTAPPQALSFRYGGDTVMNLRGDKVGIGTTNPNATLDVQGGDISVNGFEVGGFVGTVKQNSSFTIYSPWTDVPGVIFCFQLPINKSVNLRAFSSTQISGGHAGFRFVIDGVPYGDPDYGDLIVSGGSPGWHSWYIERIVEISAGEHCVKLQMRCGGGTLISQGLDYDAARLFVEAW